MEEIVISMTPRLPTVRFHENTIANVDELFEGVPWEVLEWHITEWRVKGTQDRLPDDFAAFGERARRNARVWVEPADKVMEGGVGRVYWGEVKLIQWADASEQLSSLYFQLVTNSTVLQTAARRQGPYYVPKGG